MASILCSSRAWGSKLWVLFPGLKSYGASSSTSSSHRLHLLMAGGFNPLVHHLQKHRDIGLGIPRPLGSLLLFRVDGGNRRRKCFVPDANQSNPESLVRNAKIQRAISLISPWYFTQTEQPRLLIQRRRPQAPSFWWVLWKSSPRSASQGLLPLAQSILMYSVYPVAHRDHGRLLCYLLYGFYATGDQIALTAICLQAYTFVFLVLVSFLTGMLR